MSRSTDGTAVDGMLVDTADRLFAALGDADGHQEAERTGWAADMWSAVAELGLPWIGVAEEAGGQGGTLGDALAVLRRAGAHALPLPLAETGLLAGWLLAGAGVPVPAGPLSPVPGRAEDTLCLRDWRLYGTAHRVPWARDAELVVALLPDGDGWQVAAAPASEAVVVRSANLAGEPRDDVSFDGVRPRSLRPSPVGPRELLYRGALTRSVLMAGALERVCELTVRYTAEREQFGRAISRFQAVSQHVVTVVQDTALVGLAATRAADAAADGPACFEIAAAKLLANQAVHTAVRGAYQAHGAMGVTREYPLHRVTRRLHAWRAEYGDERLWALRLGGTVADLGADALYPLITAGSSLVGTGA